MNAPSFEFVGFGLVSAVVLNLIPSLRWRRLAMVAASLAFFALFAKGIVSVLPYVGFLVVGYLAMRLTWRNRGAGVLTGSVAVILLMFFWLKHYGFIPKAGFLPFSYITIGLSYVFFRVLHLVIEARQGGLKERPSVVNFLNYALHFPALISGPIQYYNDFIQKEDEERLPLDLFTIGEAAWRIILGFFKVAIVSVILMKIQQDNIAELSDNLPLLQKTLTGTVVWAIYPLFLYANFSGYTDFVIGIAALHRFKLPENFNNPFVSENFITFWSRWHISLSDWLKTYVYMPFLMATMRRFPSRKAEQWFGVAAYFITFFLVGAWHGQTSMFLMFGVLQGGGVAINKLYQNLMTNRLGRKGYGQLAAKPMYRLVARGLTYTWFAFTMLWFWSDAAGLTARFATMGWEASLLSVALVLAGAAIGLGILTWATAKLPEQTKGLAPRYWKTALGTIMILVVLISQFVLAAPAADIVYKNF